MQTTKTTRQYGLWESPISARAVAVGLRLSDVAWDTDGKTAVWLEGRSDRGVLVASTNGEAPRDLTPDLKVRAKVGYGGGDFTVAHGSVYFAEANSGALHRQDLSGGVPKRLTPPFGAAASPQVSPDGRFVAYVHHDDRRTDRLAIVDTEGRHWPRIFFEGHDFFTQPRWSPDGQLFAFVAWDHPQMPWDGASLYVAPVVEQKDGLPVLGEPKKVAGGPDVSVFQPEFSSDGRHLYFVSDESGYWQIHVHDLVQGGTRRITQDEFEYGQPNWVQEMRTYGVTKDGRIYAAVNKRGFVRMHQIDLKTGEATLIEPLAGYTDVAQVTVSSEGVLAFVASSPVLPARVVAYDPRTETPRVLARSGSETLAPQALSQPQALTWRTTGGSECHGIYYPPASERFVGTGVPPLLVLIHGGPTSQVRAGWDARAQYFATRGWGVLFVNYRGSTGYGRAYMLKLRGNWGVHDVEDAVSGARFLAESGKVDGRKTVIMGGSAGGFTVLQTMIRAPEAFAAGISMYGVANQFTLAADTHKFEERYLDSLLGPLPEAAALYRERSPVFHADKIKRPLAVFQGDEDRVVPKDQSDVIVEALRRNRTPHVYHVYEGEGHGWRKTETVEHFFNAVEDFLKQYVLFA